MNETDRRAIHDITVASPLRMIRNGNSVSIAVDIPPPRVVSKLAIVKITSNASGGGKYNGRVMTGSSTAVATGTLAMPEGMTTPDKDNALVLNIYETGANTHDLAVDSFHMGRIVGATDAGLSIVMIQSVKILNCS